MSPPSGKIPRDPSPPLAAVLKALGAFSADDIAVLNEVTVDTYTHEVLPKSVSLPIQTKEEWLNRVGKSKALLQDIHVSKYYIS